MTSISVQAAFAVLFLFVAVCTADDGQVSFWREKVTLTCPQDGEWFDIKDEKVTVTGWNAEIDGNKFEFQYESGTKGQYYCKYNDQSYYFYVQGKVCESCFELDGTVVLWVIIADASLTLFVMVIICRCTKKKSSSGLSPTPTPPARPGRGPPASSSTYEDLNPRTRSQDPYSVVNRMG